MSTIFLTGATGFLGSRLIHQLGGDGHNVLALTRHPGAQPPPGVQWIEGDLNRPDSYEYALASADTVIHAAAVTGKAPPSQYHTVNVVGTRDLVDQSVKHGVDRFVFISSVAAGFERDYRYHYAHSKREAERAVLRSDMRTLILRPTMLMGRDGAVVAGLRKLSDAPIIPLFGAARHEVQPIHVDDMVRTLAAVLHRQFDGDTVTVGGPDRLQFRDLLGRMHSVVTGKQPRFLRIPLWSVLPILTVLEMVAYPLTPITVGQLASFRNPGCAEPHPLTDNLLPHQRSIEEMIRESVTP